MAFQPEYGVIGAGAVHASIIGKFPGKAQALGPVAASSPRVATRLANMLRAGYGARSADELNAVKLILFYAPEHQLDDTAAILLEAEIDWKGKSVIFCDCSAAHREMLTGKGAAVASLRSGLVPDHAIVEGSTPALTRAQRFAREVKLKPVEIAGNSAERFEAALMLGRGALTPLIDSAARVMRECGLRDREAADLATAVFIQTARDYQHSGRQSWEWHVREPDVAKLRERIGAAGEPLTGVLAKLLELGCEVFEKHPEAAAMARQILESE